MAVELTDSAKASVKDVENIRKLSGPAKQAATRVAQNKRRKSKSLAQTRSAISIMRGNQTTDSNN